MAFINQPDIQDDTAGNVSIKQQNGNAANLNVTGNFTGTWFTFTNIQNNGNSTILIKNKDGSTAANLAVSGAATISGALTVSSTSSLNGKTSINSQSDNLPLQVSGSGGQFWFYSSGGQNNGAVIRGSQNQYGLVFTGTDRVRVEGVSGDNRIATMQDLASITFMQNQGLVNGEIATGFNS